ncbi:MAG TPA: hypothetical protein VL551_28920 [Actinospica sp.]|jgi:hypothetical protein|nr:hypothetical protein [Actinospica sp.]
MVDPPRRLAAALAGVGAVLCVLGWYQISGQPTVAQQLPYLASATIPGAALLAVGLGLALRTPWPRRGRERADVAPSGGVPAAGSGLRRVPDGRYLHTPDCPLLDGRDDVLEAESGLESELRACPLCHAGAED